MEVNYLGSVYATRAVLPYMKKRSQGRIIFISSQAGQLGLYGYSSYSGSKFALRGFAEALQMEVREKDFINNSLKHFIPGVIFIFWEI